MSDFVIETRGLTKQYGPITALKGLDLAVPRHSIFGFLGPNGAGKTTTMKLLLGLMKPSSGGGTIFGHDIVSENMAIRQRIGYLPQQPRFYDELTARETLRFTASLFFTGPQPLVEERVEEVLELVGLQQKADRAVRGFSGGERQRLGIAQAQVNYPDLLILDEPAAALDPIGRRDVLAVMERLRAHTTIFYSTHILDDVQQVSDTAAILNQGELVVQGPIELLLNGGSGSVYEVKFKGETQAAYERVVQQPWVGAIGVERQNGHTSWQVTVEDDAAAEAQLLRLLVADNETTVTGFGHKQFELEEIFIQLVEGGRS